MAFPDLVACEHCDTVCRRLPLGRREVACCARCGAVLYRVNRLSIDDWLALTLAAAFTFVIANFTPIVRISFEGQHNEATLWGAIGALAHGTAAPIAIPAALAVIVVPFLQIAALAWLLGYARLRRRAPGFAALMRLLVALRPWSMVEVLMLGILVAIVKLSSDLDVIAGPGVWATAVLTLQIAVIAGRDVHQLWDAVEPSGSRRAHA
ncbi:MAG TPA: paraquat-inducible protein A [Burkholderiaceae bacterium]|jgi:paraquat-inducible protein A